MKALVLTQYMHLELQDLPAPVPGPGEVLIRVQACGICGSDVHGMDGSTGRRIPPIVMGHEAAGVVADVGEGVTAYQPGDRVTFDSTVSCGACHFCRRGLINLCDKRRVLGVSCAEYRKHGAFAEYVAVPEHIVYPLPDSLSFEQAAMIEAVSVAVHAVNLTPLRLGDTAVVVGCGMIGALAVQALKAAGCARVFGIDVDMQKLELARRLGACNGFLAGGSEDAAEMVRAHTGGRGADCALEAVGSSAALQTAVAAVRKGGAVTLVGNLSPSVDLPLQSVVTRQVRLQGSCASSGEYPACIELMASGRIQVDPLISAVAPLEEGPAYFERLFRREPKLMKVILTP